MDDLKDLSPDQNKEFWAGIRASMIAGEDDNVRLRELLTPLRMATKWRLLVCTDAEVLWLSRKIREKRRVRIYRAAALPGVSGFRWHTSLKHAMAEIHGEPKAILTVAEIDPRRVLMRIEEGGRKQILCLPEAVRPIKVDALTLESA